MLYGFIGILFGMLVIENNNKTNLVSKIRKLNGKMLIDVGTILIKVCASKNARYQSQIKNKSQRFIKELKDANYDIIINTELIKHYKLSNWFFIFEILALVSLCISGITREFISTTPLGKSLYILSAFLAISIVVLRLFFIRIDGNLKTRFITFKQNLIGKKDEN